MQNIFSSITEGFSKILKWHTMKYALIAGIVSILIWGIIGMLFWDNLIALSTKILELIPFSMVRSNGAWILSAFIWFQLVLISFAIIYALFGNFILQKISKEKFSKFAFYTIFISALFWGVVWFFANNYIYNQLLKLFTWLPFETVEKGVGALIALYIIYNAIIITILFFASIFSEPLVASIYNSVKKENIFKSIKWTIKDTLIFIAISMVTFPLLFMPVLNILVQLLLWIWLFKDTISMDALYLSGRNKNILKEHKVAIYAIMTFAVILNFLPLFNIFAPFFAEIAMFNYLKNIKESIW